MDATHSDSPSDVAQQPSEPPVANEDPTPPVERVLRRWPWLVGGLAVGAVVVTVARFVPTATRFFRTPGWRWTAATAIVEMILHTMLAVQRLLFGRPVPALAQPIKRSNRTLRKLRSSHAA